MDDFNITHKKLSVQIKKKEDCMSELIIANKKLAFQHEASLKAVLDESSILAITDLDGIIIQASDNLCNISKYTREELIGKDYRIINSGYHSKEFINNLWETIADGKIWKNKIKNKAKDGSYYWLDITIIPFMNERSVTYKYVIIKTDITERKNVEEKLLASEVQYRRLFEAAKDGILILNSVTGMIEDVNPFLEQKLGYSHAEFLGKQLWEFGFFKDILENKSAFIQLKKEGYIRYEDLPLKTIDGRAIWVEFVSNVYDVSGKQVIQCNIRDITERKKTEENLQHSEAHLTEAQRLAKMGSWNFDLKADRLTWSDELYHVFDSDKQPFIETHSSFLHLIDEEDREFAMQTSRHTQQTGEPFTIDYHITTPKGEKRIIQEHGYGVKDEHGIVTRLFGTAQDITERKKTEEKLLQSEAKFRHLMEAVPDAIVGSDKKGKIVYANIHASILFGYSTNELLNIDVEMLLPERFQNEHASHRAGYHNSLLSREIGKDGMLLYGRRKDGSEFATEISLSRIETEEGLIVLSAIRDITEKKNAEQIQLKITADIIQRNKDLEQFSYIVSHNLRAPVANIIGLSYIFQDEKIAPEMKKEIMEGLSHSVKKLDEVIIDLNNILQTNRNVSQKKELVYFSKITSDIYSSIENLIEKEHATLIWDFSEADEMITVKSYLHSIFYNLISNSLKYHQPKIAPVIEIKSCKLENKIVLLFKDNGMGIDLKKRGDQVFGLYKRFHTSSAEGKGMGLYMVKTQVETIGGEISIESEVNKGTTFKIEFEI